MRCRPVIIIEVLDEYDSLLRSVVVELFGSGYRWERIDEGNDYPNHNVLLTPVASERQVTSSAMRLYH